MNLFLLITIIGLIISLLLLMFSLAIIVDSFAIPALQRISKKYNLPKQAEGILLALGTCIPEFANNLAASVSGNISIGVGAISGSGAFDFTICFGLIPFISGYPILHKKLFYRDSLIYIFTLILLTFFIQDGKISFYEILILTSLWPIYIIFIIFFWDKKRKRIGIFGDKFYKRKRQNTRYKDYIQLPTIPEEFERENEEQIINTLNLEKFYEEDKTEELIENNLKEPLLLSEKNIYLNSKDTSSKENKKYLKYVHSKLDIFSKNIAFIYSYFIPVWENSPILTFFFLAIFLFLHSFLLILIVNIISSKLNIKATFLGMTLMAIGGNLGDTINALIATKNNEISLITTSVLSGQITTLQFCLGFPWLIFIIKEKISGRKGDYIYFPINKEKSNNPLFFFAPLLLCVIASIVILSIYDMELNKKSGGLMILTYLIYFTFEFYISMK